jgi:hypothetical protein
MVFLLYTLSIKLENLVFKSYELLAICVSFAWDNEKDVGKERHGAHGKDM